MASVFEMVAGLSPWAWLAISVVLGIVEMVTMSFFLIGPALAALIMAGIVVFVPEMAGELRVLLFAVISVVLTFFGRSFVRRFGDGGGQTSTINDRSAQLVGRRATVLEWANGEGAVEIDGIRWRAAWEGAEAAATGSSVEVIASRGMTLTVRNAAN